MDRIQARRQLGAEAMSQEWYYARGDQKHGPVTSEQLRALARSGGLAPSDLVWTEGMGDWRQASSVKDLIPPARSTPPPLKPTGPVKPPTHVTTNLDDAVGGVAGAPPRQPWYCHWAVLTLTTLTIFPATWVLVWWKSTYPKWGKWAWTVAACFMAAGYLSSKPAKNEAPSVPQASVVKAPDNQAPQKKEPVAVLPPPMARLPQSAPITTSEPATSPVPSSELGKLEPVSDTLNLKQGQRQNLVDHVQNFIDVPSGARELPDVALSQSFYPFLKRERGFPTFQVDAALGPGVLEQLYVMWHEPGGKLRREDRVRVLVDRSDGFFRVLPKPSAETNPSLESDNLKLYRVRDNFVEIGTPSGRTVWWERVIKIGAKKGDAWDSSSYTDGDGSKLNGSKSVLRTIFSYHDEPCAVIEEDQILDKKSHFRKTTWYLKGKGNIRSENRQISDSGQESILYREEMVHWSGEPAYSSE